LRTRQQPLQLDVDLTGRLVGASSQTYPAAAFGSMDGQIRLGYQLATLCLQITLFGCQWLVGSNIRAIPSPAPVWRHCCRRPRPAWGVIRASAPNYWRPA
jgi:hypothetical protein